MGAALLCPSMDHVPETDGWSNVVISRNGRYIEVTGSMNGQAGKMAVDSQTGRLRANNYDDDDDDD